MMGLERNFALQTPPATTINIEVYSKKLCKQIKKNVRNCRAEGHRLPLWQSQTLHFFAGPEKTKEARLGCFYHIHHTLQTLLHLIITFLDL